MPSSEQEIKPNDDPAVLRPAPRRKMAAGRRRALLWVAGIVVVVGLLEAVGWPFLRVPIEKGLARALDREITLGGPFAIRFIGHLRVRAEQLVIGPAPAGPTLRGKPMDLLRANQLRVSVPYTTIFSLISKNDDDEEAPAKRPFISVLEVAALEANLLRDADGRANWRLGAQEQTKSRPLALPEFRRLALAKAKIVVDDALYRIAVEADVQTNTAAPVNAGGGAPEPGIAGLEASARGSYRDQPFTARLRSSGLLTMAVTEPGAAPHRLHLEVRAGPNEADFEGEARDLFRLIELHGRYRIAGESLAGFGSVVGATLPTTSAFTMRGTLTKEGAVWSTAVGELAVGESRLNGAFRYDPTPAVPKLSGRLGGALLSLPDLAPAVGASPKPRERAARAADRKPPADRRVNQNDQVGRRADASPVNQNDQVGRRADAPPEKTPPRARLLPQREFNTPSLAAMDADVAVALDRFDLGTDKLEKMSPFRAHIVLEKQVLELRDIAARTASGELLGTISFDARQKTPLWKADLRWSGVDLERFVKPRDVSARKTSRGYLSGVLAGRARLGGSGRSTAAILATLDGDVQMWVRNGQISHFLVEVLGLDVAQALGILVRGDASLAMRCAVTALNVRQGKIVPEVALIETSDSTLRATGTVSLGDERLELVFRAEPKDVSPATLRSPVFVEGTFSDPEVRVDKTSIGMRVVAAAALAAVTPLASLLALVDLGEGEKKACQDALARLQGAGQRPAAPPRGRTPPASSR